MLVLQILKSLTPRDRHGMFFVTVIVAIVVAALQCGSVRNPERSRIMHVSPSLQYLLYDLTLRHEYFRN
jgi:hypothetical protein